MKLKIRFAEIKDFENVRRSDPHSQYIDPNRIKTKIQSHEIILACSGKEIIGIIEFSYFWSTRPYMDLIWVKEEERGKKIGSQLLVFLEKYLVREGYFYLFTSSQVNEPAPQEWHQKHGFKKCGVLSKINLPHEKTNEIFFCKHLTKTEPKKEKLKTYPIISNKSSK